MKNIDKQVLRFLVTLLVGSGYSVSVFCEGDELLNNSRDVNDIMGDAYSVEECTLKIFDAFFNYAGMFFIVYNGDGNIICDHSDNTICETFCNEVCAKFDL